MPLVSSSIKQATCKLHTDIKRDNKPLTSAGAASTGAGAGAGVGAGAGLDSFLAAALASFLLTAGLDSYKDSTNYKQGKSIVLMARCWTLK